jgi:8-amino-7-oxononanoate synthase
MSREEAGAEAGSSAQLPAAVLAPQLEALASQGLLRSRRLLQSPQQAQATVDGRQLVAFCSNDYLGLAADPRLRDAVIEGVHRYGVGAGASHLILGHSAAHHQLEAALAAFVSLPRALLFSTGYMANLGVVTALVGRGDAVFADRLNHASLNDAAQLSRAEFKRYVHGDLAMLVISDAVFSMDGDIAPVAALLELCERHDAWLLLDDAHGFGVLGKTGGGVLQHYGIASERIIYMATLGKAAGVSGAFVAAAPAVIEWLVQRARPYIYTTATPPLLAHALLKSLEIIAAGSDLRARLAASIASFRQGCDGLPWRLMPSDTAIQPLIIGGSEAAVQVAEALAARGLLVPAIRPPTVPDGTARLRVSLSAEHQPEQIDQLLRALHAIGAAS